MVGYTDGKMDGQTDSYRWTDGWMDRQIPMDGQMDRWTDGYIYILVDGWIYSRTSMR